jgi:hypothetical protein
MIAAAALGVLILLVWGVLIATLADLHTRDAMGRALAQGFASLEVIALWVLLGILLAIAAASGAMSWIVALAVAAMLVASAVASLSAVGLLADQGTPPVSWPIVPPALTPLVVLSFCCWTMLAGSRTKVPSSAVAATALGAMFVLTAAVLPMHQIRERAERRDVARRQDWANDFARLPADAPLWELAPFLATRDEIRVQAVLDRVRHLDRRQADAEIMLDRGDFPLVYLGAFDLDPTSAICAKARDLLRRRVQPLVPQRANAAPYAVVADDVAGAVAAMDWLVGYGCSCDAEAQAWEDMGNAYRNPNFDVVRLRELRDPAELGRILREHPARFSMLTPQAHLKAWLQFAKDSSLRDQALAGARRIDHRTADAVEMLHGDEFSAYAVLTYMPVLDLDATPELCDASLQALHAQLSQIFRPKADDPKPYQELLERLGVGRPLDALQWLASHGCDAGRELDEAEALVRSYQDSPARADMLTRLAELHRT